MTLYETLAPLYDSLFPIDPRAAAFLASLVPAGGRRPCVLDAGCATGGHALDLAELGWTAVGIDSEAAMISLALAAGASRGGGRASFYEADMLSLADRFAGRSFDLVLCLGNTLPHLLGAAASSFLAQAHALLAPGGALVLQTLNFSLPRVAPGFVFPEISGAGAVMRRSYHEPPQDQAPALRFVVELESGGLVQRGETLLTPLGPRDIGSLLARAGFGTPSRFSGWEGRGFDEAVDLYCLTVAKV